MESNFKNTHFAGDYKFLNNINYQLFKPNNNLSCCSDLMLNLLGNKITDNFKDPIKLLLDYFKTDYYQKLLDIIDSNNKLFTLPIEIKSSDINHYIKDIYLRYIESNIKYKLIVSFKPLDINADIFYHLTNLNLNKIMGIIFQIDILTNEYQTYDYYKKLSENNDGSLYFYYIDSQNIINNTSNKLLYELNNFNMIREISQVIFNDLSMEILDLIRLDRILTKQFYQTIYNHLIYKRFLYSKVSTLDQIRFVLFSCSALFSLGNTYCKDIDLLVYSEYLGPEIKMTIDEYFKNDRFNLIDFHMKGFGEWTVHGKKTYLNDWFVKEWPNLYGSKDIEQSTFDPQFYFYFMGMKIISYKADIIRRVKRNRATSYTDLIMLDYFNGLIIKPFKLERDYWVNNKEQTYTDKDLIYLIIKVLKNVIRWHNIKIKAKRVYNYIIWPNNFKLKEKDLNKIDQEIDSWTKYSNSDIYDIKEKIEKIELNIETYKKS